MRKDDVIVKCFNCENTIIRRRSELNRFGTECRSCLTSRISKTCIANNGHMGAAGKSKSGAENSAWKGGFRYGINGRFGKDKNGLSWKKQRRLAWERDQYTCQKCGKEKTDRNPDVHHIVRYVNSLSHDLKNLICLCKKCHKQEDRYIRD